MADKRVAILKRANKLFRQGKAEAAVKEYKKILTIKPDDLEVRRIVGDLELRQNNTKDAVEQFEWIADYYLKEGFFAKAIAMFKRITRVEPNYEGALFKLAGLYTKQGLVMEAKQIYLDIAEECKRQNNQKKALDMYKKILEFDRSNIKMRLLLADNYLKEGLENDAVIEYLTAVDIILSKKDYERAENLLIKVLEDTKNPQVIEKLVQIHTSQGADDKAIELLNSMGPGALENVDLLKTLGELHLKKNDIDEAEKIFSKIARIDPGETEVVMRLGKVYLQREDYDRAYNLFLPMVDQNIQNKKYDDAASMLRFIIASNNSFVPALNKLAEIFKISEKIGNLIALYESMLPIYEEKGMIVELRTLLEELIQLSDTPFTYEEHLARLSGLDAKAPPKPQSEKDRRKEKEAVGKELQAAEEALNLGDMEKALEVLKKTKATFPKNIDVRKRLFEIYEEQEQNELAVTEGKGLLELYKFFDMNHEHTDLVEKLSVLRPDDEGLVSLSHDERTSIDINIDRDELNEHIREFESRMEADSEDDIMILGEPDGPAAESAVGASDEPDKGLSSVLSEVDFYLNDGYFGDAEKLLDQLKEKYPGHPQLLEKIEKLEKTKKESGSQGDSAPSTTGLDFEIEDFGMDSGEDKSESGPGFQQIAEQERGNTERLSEEDGLPLIHHGDDADEDDLLGDIDVEEELADSQPPPADLNLSDSDSLAMPDEMLLDVMEGVDEPAPVHEEAPEPPSPPFAPSPEPEPEIPMEPEMSLEPEPEIPMEPEMSLEPEPEMPMEPEMSLEPEPEMPMEPEMSLEPEPEIPMEPEMSLEPEMPMEPEMSLEPEPEMPMEPEMALEPEPEPEMPFDAGMATMPELDNEQAMPMEPEAPGDDDMNLFELESSSGEQMTPSSEAPPAPAPTPPPPPAPPTADDDADLDLDLDLDEEPIPAPSTPKTPKEDSSAGMDDLDLDNMFIGQDSGDDFMSESDSPFKDTGVTDQAFAPDEDFLQEEEAPFLEEADFHRVEDHVKDELDTISFWLQELEKQRTSSIERNMMDIFEEFKKGVDEKIGQEDFDTRYNLGIAYKEMGLLEEAIHEFLISSKSPMKFFDSAGLLGLCFREKGLFAEAINWFERALGTPDRIPEEYLAIQYEMVLTYKQKEDYRSALEMAVKIGKVNPKYRDVAAMYNELKTLYNQARQAR